ncbi:hypothetical protein LIER_11203 [Lithospermum erythrorhizon]|uniref:Integrase catalytic domain-containing protein n=1 Tax=Lithospermum erythrorhizon TaxID=34254 RepID=A0AAV3PNQ4_LITER
MSLKDYYNKLTGLFDELARLKPPHRCSCGLCTCGVVVRYETDLEEERLHKFLVGIDDELYGIVRSNLLSRVHMPSLDEAMFYNKMKTLKMLLKGRLMCTHCRQSGHDNSSCFKLHGYPPWWEEQRQLGKSQPTRTGAAPAVHAGPSREAGAPSIHVVLPAPESAVVGGVNSGHESLADLKPDQVWVLMNMICNQQTDTMAGEFSFGSWILDTGASYDVTGSRSCLMAARDISSCPVGLPNGHSALATMEGRVRLPGVCAVTVSGLSEFELWHHRLGHPFDIGLKLVPVIQSSSARKHLDSSCTIYHQVKQCRDSFPLSESRVSTIFELLHCDLWGPNKVASSNGALYFLTIVDNYSRAVWVYLLHSKSEVFKSFCSFVSMVERQFHAHLKVVRSDNGTEFENLLPYFNERGILFQNSCVGTEIV